MATITGSGASILRQEAAAAREAVGQGLARLAGREVAFGFVFASPEYRLEVLLEAISGLTGGADLMACSTAGELTERGLTHHGVAVLLIASDELTHDLVFAGGMRESPARIAAELCKRFPETRRAAFSKKRIRATTVLLTDGLAGTGEHAVREICDRTSAFQQIVGGAAGDEASFRATRVGASGQVGTDAMAALHIFSSKDWGVGVGHGLRPNSERMRVTRAAGNIVYELDGEPAFEVYKQHARRRGVALTPGDAGPYLIGNELGIYFFDRISRARAPLQVGRDGSLSCAAAVPEGANVCILDGDPDSMVSAAREAANEASRNLAGRRAAGVLLFDCVCRGMILREQFSREIESVRSVFGDVPVAGFLTYGEIARYKGKLGGWHNATAVVLAIPE